MLDSKYITIDSGEHSDRKTYTQALLKYFNYTAGHPTIALSQVNPQNTKNYLLLLPKQLRSKVLSIGFYHTFLNVTEETRKILYHLYLDDSNREYINQLIEFIETITLRLINELNDLNIFVILDRSILTNYAYTAVLNTNQPNMVEELIKRGAVLKQKGIFIESSLTPSSTDVEQFYDVLGSEFNIRLASWYKTLAMRSNNICIISATDALNEGMRKVINFLNEV